MSETLTSHMYIVFIYTHILYIQHIHIYSHMFALIYIYLLVRIT